MRLISRKWRNIELCKNKAKIYCTSLMCWSTMTMNITTMRLLSGKKLSSLSGAGKLWFTISMKLSDSSMTRGRSKRLKRLLCLEPKRCSTSGLSSTTLLSSYFLLFSRFMHAKKHSTIGYSSSTECTSCSIAFGKSKLSSLFKISSTTRSFFTSTSGTLLSFLWER